MNMRHVDAKVCMLHDLHIMWLDCVALASVLIAMHTSLHPWSSTSHHGFPSILDSKVSSSNLLIPLLGLWFDWITLMHPRWVFLSSPVWLTLIGWILIRPHQWMGLWTPYWQSGAFLHGCAACVHHRRVVSTSSIWLMFIDSILRLPCLCHHLMSPYGHSASWMGGPDGIGEFPSRILCIWCICWLSAVSSTVFTCVEWMPLPLVVPSTLPSPPLSLFWLPPLLPAPSIERWWLHREALAREEEKETCRITTGYE